MPVMRRHDVGELQALPEVPGSTVRGFRRPLRNLLENLVELFLSNQRMRKSLTWFNGRKNHFVFAVGGDGTPNSRGDPDLTIWSLSVLNRGRHVGSPQDNFLLAVAGCKEEHPVMMAYARELVAEIDEISASSIEVDGESYTFACGLVPVDMKYLAKLAGEVAVGATYSLPFANVKTSDLDEKGEFSLDGTKKWKPWCFEHRLEVARKVSAFKRGLDSDLSKKTRRTKITTFIADQL